MRKLLVGTAVATAFMAWATVSFAQKEGAHLLSSPTCTLSGGSIVCTGGSAAGRGNQPVFVTATVPAGCQVRPGTNEPGGHAQATTGPLNPRGGRINFIDVTLSADCPPGLNPFYGSTVTYTIRTADGTLVFTFTVAVT